MSAPPDPGAGDLRRLGAGTHELDRRRPPSSSERGAAVAAIPRTASPSARSRAAGTSTSPRIRRPPGGSASRARRSFTCWSPRRGASPGHRQAVRRTSRSRPGRHRCGPSLAVRAGAARDGAGGDVGAAPLRVQVPIRRPHGVSSTLALLGARGGARCRRRSAQAPPIPTLPPAVVEGARVPPERTATEQEAREEIQRVPGA